MFIVFTDCSEKTPSFESDSGIPIFMLAVISVIGTIVSIVTLLVIAMSMYFIRRCIKHS